MRCAGWGRSGRCRISFDTIWGWWEPHGSFMPEGDCGSCTILLGRADGGQMNYRTVCSCIQFLSQLDCTHIVTVEGLKYDGKLNPVQEAMVACQGSQCGFCTPGFVVSMCGMFEDRSQRAAGPRDVQKACVGNLCRCTGYESILKAGSSVEAGTMKPLGELYPPEGMLRDFEEHEGESVVARHGERMFGKPASVAEACKFRAENPACAVISGGTDVGVQINKGIRDPKVILSLSALRELQEITGLKMARLSRGGDGFDCRDGAGVCASRFRNMRSCFMPVWVAAD